MRIPSELRKCVVFLGTEDNDTEQNVMNLLGTGFLVAYEDFAYLVTVKHIALGLGDLPFFIRLNKKDGTSDNISVDVGDVRWFLHPDPDVDLAVIPFQYDLRGPGFDVRYLSGFESKMNYDHGFEPGDMTYTVGLFRLLSGERRNLETVHSGNIALIPGDEKIPVTNWDHEGGVRHVEGYLVQSESIQGLSGAPTFVRPHIELTDLPTGNGPTAVILPRVDIGFLGIWQGAWDAPADEVRAISKGRELRVPVGMGIVVPAYRLGELLESTEVREERERFKKARSGS